MTRKQKTVTKVLALKGFTREQMKVELKKARDAFNEEKAKLDCLEQELRAHHEEFSRKQDRGSLSVREMDLFYLYFDHLNKLIEQQKKCVLVRQEDLGEKERGMQQAYTDERLIEILHDKIVHEEVRATLQHDQKEADERFLTRRPPR